MNKWILILISAFPTASNALVITEFTTGSFGGYIQTYGGTYNRELMVLGMAHKYTLDDGSTWNAGAGWHPTQYSDLDYYYISGSTINYVLDMGIGDIIFQNTDYNSGDHSSQGVLTTIDKLILSAEIGSSTATMYGRALLYSNDETWYGEPRFNYYDAAIGEHVRFEVEYSLYGNSVWDVQTFDNEFRYWINGKVDFNDTVSVPEPSSISILLAGLAVIMWYRLTKRAT